MGHASCVPAATGGIFPYSPQHYFMNRNQTTQRDVGGFYLTSVQVSGRNLIRVSQKWLSSTSRTALHPHYQSFSSSCSYEKGRHQKSVDSPKDYLLRVSVMRSEICRQRLGILNSVLSIRCSSFLRTHRMARGKPLTVGNTGRRIYKKGSDMRKELRNASKIIVKGRSGRILDANVIFCASLQQLGSNRKYLNFSFCLRVFPTSRQVIQKNSRVFQSSALFK